MRPGPCLLVLVGLLQAPENRDIFQGFKLFCVHLAYCTILAQSLEER